MSFSISESPISASDIPHPEAGAFVTFEGKVRNHAEGKPVQSLEYEAYDEMAITQGNALLEEAIQQFALTGARAIHRIGPLEIGDTAVVVQTSSAHRREAFLACEWIMDQIKWRVPIWKRETYATGVSEWVYAGTPEPNVHQEMFARQMQLPEVGFEGQAKLAATKVLVVGVGGLAAGAIPALVGAGIGTLGLIDDDLVSISNLHRQTLFTHADIGRQKVERAAAFAKRLNPAISVHSFPVSLDERNAVQFVSGYDWIMDGTDSLSTKFLLNRACRSAGKPLVSASVHQFEGQLLVVSPDGPCLQCLFPTPPPDDCVGTCAQSGVLGVVPSLMGGLQANEVIKGVLGLAQIPGQMILFDLGTLEIERIQLAARPDCPGCLGNDSQAGQTWVLDSIPSPPIDLVDIREPDEMPELSVPHRRIHMEQCYDIEWENPTLFVCASGIRSYRLTANLRAAGFSQVYSLRDGIQNKSALND